MFDHLSQVESIEIILVGFIVLIQGLFFLNTQRSIHKYRKSIPSSNELKVVLIKVPQSELGSSDPNKILANYKKYVFQPSTTPSANTLIDGEVTPGVDSSELKINDNQSSKTSNPTPERSADFNIVMHQKGETEGIFHDILKTVNRYLIRNAGISADFNLLKDIVERNVGTIEEDINMSIPVPLYLGLVGTMMGIVIGLFGMGNLDAIAAGQANGSGISILIGGVKIAMIASFIGLLLTLLSSGITFRRARSFVEAKKHGFYSFLQIELLPVLNLNMVSTLESMHRNLMKFNQEFGNNLDQLGSTFKDSIAAIDGQKELLEALDRAKISEMARYNVNVLKQLNSSMDSLNSFNRYLGSIMSLVGASERILEQSNRFIDRTGNIETIASNIEQTLIRNNDLTLFLQDHFNKLDDIKSITQQAVDYHSSNTQKVVSDAGFEISKIFKDLHEHIIKSSQEVQQFTDKELDLLKNALTSSKTNLSNLEYLESIQNEFSKFQKLSQSQNDKMLTLISQLNKNVEASNHLLFKISTRPKSKFIDWVNKLFGSS